MELDVFGNTELEKLKRSSPKHSLYIIYVWYISAAEEARK